MIANTLLVGIGATVIAVTIGAALALMLARIRTPGRALLSRLVTLPLYITPLLTAIAWSWLGSPRGGLINLAARALFGIDSLINLHTAGGVVFVAALSYVPLPFLLIGAALRNMDPSLEESARVHGASVLASLRRVTLPLVLPAMLGSGLLVFVQAMGLFSVPAVLGMPGGFQVAGTEIYRLLNNYPPRVSQAAAWGLLLLVVTAALVWLQSMVLRRRSYVTVTGKAFRPRLLEVGHTRWLLAVLAWAYVGAAVVLPVATLVWAALVQFITIDPHLMRFDLSHFRYVLFEYPKTWLALGNSVLLGALAATCVCALGLAVSWVVVRTRGAMRPVLDQLSMFPLAMPSMVLALGLLWAYVGLKWLPIYGTIWILLIAYVTHYLPFGVRSGTAALRQLHAELEDAARMTGAELVEDRALHCLPVDAADTDRHLDAVIHPGDAGGEFVDLALHQPHHCAVGRGVRFVGSRQRQRARGTQRDPVGHHLRRIAAAVPHRRPRGRGMTLSFLSVELLAVSYGPVSAVDGVDFRIDRGEHVTLLGPSGCGKTTTLRAIAGLEMPTGGRIVIDGTVVADAAGNRHLPPERRGLSMVFQSYAIWPHMTVFDNVAFGFRVRGMGRTAARPAVERALALVDLADLADRPATRLSGGQQQRVALARALAYDSKIVLLDEPLSNLDAQLRIAMRAELADLRRRLGFTAIYVTHDQEEAFALSDRIIVMRGGRIEQQGTPAEIHAAPRTRFVAGFLGMRNIIPAEIANIGAGQVEARLAPGIVLRARDPWPDGTLPNAAGIGFRPVDVQMERDGDGCAGVITRSLYLGDVAHYTIRSGPIEITAHDRPRAELAEGSEVHWSVPPEHCLLLRE